MARIRVEVDEPAARLTLKAMLEAEGHALVPGDADLCIADTAERAAQAARSGPALILATAGSLSEAVDAMRRGVFGYILTPFVPGEAALMVQRALRGGGEAAAAEPQHTRLADVERAHIEAIMRRCKHNQAEAARVLGIARNTLWRKLKQFGRPANA